jgi:transposase
MIKIFDSTRYVKTDVSDSKVIGNFPDVEPFELYLQLNVKSQWDFNINNFFLVFDGEFTYYVILASKKDNETYHTYKKLRKEDVTEEYEKAISKFLNK